MSQTFDDIENVTLRTWNRCSMAFNILEDKGEEASQAYLEQFDNKERKQMMVMFNYIRAKGYEATKAEVMRTTGHLEC